MPEKRTVQKAKRMKKQGKAPTTQAGPFIEEEVKHVRSGKHGARSTKQAIAIGLSKARAAGVNLPPPKNAKKETRQSAESARRRARRGGAKSPTRSRATSRALKREGRSAASHRALSRQARTAARRRKAK